jgi:hypothetical protein
MTNHADALEQLSRANPVTSDEPPRLDEDAARRMLASIIPGVSGRKRSDSRRTRIGLGLLAAAVGAAIAAAVTLTGQSRSPGHSRSADQSLLVPRATLAQPLGPSSTQVTLADGTSALGGPLTLPDSTLASSANAGPVWTANYGGNDAVVAVTFPQTGLIIEYARPVQTPSSLYQTLAQEHPSSMSAIDLSGQPALAVAQNSDQTGTSFGSVEFVAGGTQITVLGHYNQATLKSVAQSILARANS